MDWASTMRMATGKRRSREKRRIKSVKEENWAPWAKAVNRVHEMKNQGKRWRYGDERRDGNNALGDSRCIKVKDDHEQGMENGNGSRNLLSTFSSSVSLRQDSTFNSINDILYTHHTTTARLVSGSTLSTTITLVRQMWLWLWL